MTMLSAFSRAFRRKTVVSRSDVSGTAHPVRTLTLLDLTLLGVGGTLGSGLFFLTGYVAREVAGPAVSVSFALAGGISLLSALSYAEMAARVPSIGGAYAFAYAAIGEWPAFLVGMCLTLEYGVSTAAVARAWATYLGSAMTALPVWATGAHSGVCVLGAALIATLAAVLSAGLERAKWVINSCTYVYVGLACAIVILGAGTASAAHWQPFAPFGAAGVVRGASIVFFAYLGFDEVAVVSEEALHPARDVPLAILLSLLVVSSVYIAAALVLTGDVTYGAIDLDAPFSEAMRAIGRPFAARLVGFGTAVGLTNTALVGFAAQARLFVAMGRDALLPRVFARSLRISTALCGCAVALLAFVVPGEALSDVVSGGTLVAFLATNVTLLLTRCRQHATARRRAPPLIAAFVVSCVITAFSIRTASASWIPFSFFLPAMLTLAGLLCREDFSACHTSTEEQRPKFLCPLVPGLPLAGIFSTAFLLFQLPRTALFALGVLMIISTLVYVGYSINHTMLVDVHDDTLRTLLERDTSHPLHSDSGDGVNDSTTAET